jgi:exoribonuclease R
MDAEGKILGTWYGRGVISTCARLNYDQAQVRTLSLSACVCPA